MLLGSTIFSVVGTLFGQIPSSTNGDLALVRTGLAGVRELVAYRFPVFAAVVRPLDQLPEPSTALG